MGANEEIIRYAGPDTRRFDLAGRSMTPGIIYTNGDNAVPGGDLVKTSQWGGRLYPAIGGKDLDQILATFAQIVEQEGAPGESLFLRLQDQWAAKAMEAWNISTLDEIAPDVPIIVYLDPSFAFSNTAMIELAIESGFPADWEAHPEIHELVGFSVDMRSGIEQRDSEPLGINNVIEKQHGIESLERMAPLRSLLDRGIPFHIEGSYPGRRGVDWPTWNMYKAVARIDEDGRAIGPGEAIDRETAFIAMTRWPVRYLGALDELGSIEPGKLADLVVFDGSIMDVPIEDLPGLLPVMTMVGGWIAYEDGAAGL